VAATPAHSVAEWAVAALEAGDHFVTESYSAAEVGRIRSAAGDFVVAALAAYWADFECSVALGAGKNSAAAVESIRSAEYYSVVVALVELVVVVNQPDPVALVALAQKTEVSAAGDFVAVVEVKIAANPSLVVAAAAAKKAGVEIHSVFECCPVAEVFAAVDEERIAVNQGPAAAFVKKAPGQGNHLDSNHPPVAAAFAAVKKVELANHSSRRQLIVAARRT